MSVCDSSTGAEAGVLTGSSSFTRVSGMGASPAINAAALHR
jgi:hypothetical protein